MVDENNNDGAAGFLKGHVNPEDLNKNDKPEKKAEEPKDNNAAPSSGGAGFLGAMAQQPAPESSPEKPAEKEEEAPPSDSGNSSAGFMGGEAEEEVQQSPQPEDSTPSEESGIEEQISEPVTDQNAVSEEPQQLPPSSAPAADFFARGEELSESGHYNSAITAYRKGLDKQPGNVIAINNLAMIYIELDRLNEARTELEQAVSAGNATPEIYSNLGYVLRKQGNDQSAADAYEKYLELGENIEEAEKIRSWIESVRQEETAGDAQAVSEEDISSGAGGPNPEEQELLNKASGLYDSGDFNESINTYNKCLNINPDSSAALLGRGKAEIKAGLLQEAVVTLREALSICKDNEEIYYILGFALRSMQRDTEAAEAYEKYLELAPDAEGAQKIRGWIDNVKAAAPVEESGGESAPESEQAEEEEEQPQRPKIEKQPAWATAMEEPQYDTSHLVETDDDSEVAPSVEEHAPEENIESKPEPAPELSGSLDDAVDSLKEGDVEKAITIAQAIVKSDTENLEAKVMIARCFGKKGEFAKAMAILKNIINSAPDRADVWFLLGRCQQELNQTQEAKESFEQVCELEPGSEMATSAKEIIDGMSVAPDKGVCANCMESVTRDSLAEVDGKMVCVNCRDKLGKAMGGALHVDSEMAQVRKSKFDATETKRMRRQREKSRSVFKIVVVLLLLLAVGGFGGVIVLKQLKPDTYKSIFGSSTSESDVILPDDDIFGDPMAEEKKKAEEKKLAQEQAEEEEDNAPVPAEVVKFVSLPDNRIMNGFTYKYRIVCSNPELLEGAKYSVVWVGGNPAGEFMMLPDKGSFTFKPAPVDAGKTFDLKFTIKWPETKDDKPDSIFQDAKINVVNLPSVRKLRMSAPLPFNPEKSSHILTGDINGAGTDEIIFVTGDLWSGKIYALAGKETGEWATVAEADIFGRPVAAKMLDVDGDKRKEIVVADWWNSVIAVYKFTGGKLSVYQTVKLPSRPQLLAVRDAGVKNLVVYSSSGAIQIFGISAEKKLALENTIQSYYLGPWKDMGLVDIAGNTANEGDEIVLVSSGKKQPNVHAFTYGKEGATWLSYSLGRGITSGVDFSGVSKKSGGGVVIVSGGSRITLENLINREGGSPVVGESVELENNILSLSVADIDNTGKDEAVVISRDGIYFQVAESDGAMSNRIVKLDSSSLEEVPAMLSCSGFVTEDKVKDVLFAGRDGGLYLITMQGENLPDVVDGKGGEK